MNQAHVYSAYIFPENSNFQEAGGREERNTFCVSLLLSPFLLLSSQSNTEGQMFPCEISLAFPLGAGIKT